MEYISRKTLLGNIAYSVIAVVFFNAILQIVIYPVLNARLGEALFGEILYLTSIVAIVAPSFGTAAGNTRLVFQNKGETKNGDYLFFLLIACFLSVTAVIIFLGVQQYSVGIIIGISIYACLSILRCYSDIEYKLVINYKKYLIYYIVLSSGYLLGILIFYTTGNWEAVFVIGEAVVIVFALLSCTIYGKPFVYSENKKKVFSASMVLAVSYLLSNSMVQMDRILLMNFVDGESVSQYYVVSLIGKTFALLVAPLTNVVISYLSKDTRKITVKKFTKLTIQTLGISAAFFILAVIATPVFIRLLYPNMVGLGYHLIIGANIAQVAFFAASLLLTVVLTMCTPKLQFYLQIVYVILLIVLALLLTPRLGLWGFVITVMLANIFRLVSTIIAGYSVARHNKAEVNSL